MTCSIVIDTNGQRTWATCGCGWRSSVLTTQTDQLVNSSPVMQAAINHLGRGSISGRGPGKTVLRLADVVDLSPEAQ